MIIHTKRDLFSHKSSLIKCTVEIFKPFDGSRGGLRGLKPPFQISKIKESKKTKTILLKSKKKEIGACLSIFMCTRVDTCINKSKHFSFKIFLLKPFPLWKISGSAPETRFVCHCAMISATKKNKLSIGQQNYSVIPSLIFLFQATNKRN